MAVDPPIAPQGFGSKIRGLAVRDARLLHQIGREKLPEQLLALVRALLPVVLAVLLDDPLPTGRRGARSARDNLLHLLPINFALNHRADGLGDADADELSHEVVPSLEMRFRTPLVGTNPGLGYIGAVVGKQRLLTLLHVILLFTVNTVSQL